MKKSQFIILCILGVAFSGCNKMNSLLDTPAKLDDMSGKLDQMNSTTKNMNETTNTMSSTMSQMKEGMDSTNESIRMQKISIALSEMQKKENRQYLTPIPGDMMPAGKVMAESLTVDEALLFMKDYLKKINEENFNNRFPTADQTTPEGQKLLADFEHDKLADLMMITIVAGFFPDQMLNDMISQEAEQGAYRDILYQTLMLRVIFNNDLMLNASVLNEKLVTLGKINKAIEYNEKVDFITQLPFRDQIALSITGFSNSDMNKSISRNLDTTLALTNWKRIYSSASADFKAASFTKDASVQQLSIEKQQNDFKKILSEIQSHIDFWNLSQNKLVP